MGSNFSREKNESMLYKKVEIGNKYFKYLPYSITILSAVLLTFFTGGTILLIDGGITMSYLIFSLSLSIYEKLTNKYLTYLSSKKKRDFNNCIIKFYEDILSPSVNNIESLTQNFIKNENILKKTKEKFDKNKEKFLNESKQLKNKYNILIIGPTGSGKSTLINEFLNLENKAIEGIGDSITMDFKNYTTEGSKYTLIDTQGIDYSRPISEFSKILYSKIKECNEKPYSFIDMIYYCTNNMTRFQTQEFEMIKELKKLFNTEKIPLIIIFTQCYFEEDFINMKNFIKEKYGHEKYSILRLIARKKGTIEPYGLKELKIETENKLNIFKENAYASKFIGNVSKILYKEYTNSFFNSFIKGFFTPNKEESIISLFIKLFNMYRFENNDEDLSEIYMNTIIEIKNNFIISYQENLDELTNTLIDLHAESCVKKDKNIQKEFELPGEYELLKEEKKKSLINNEYNIFRDDIDKIVFPCCLDILKIEIIKTFNSSVFEELKPKIKELMAQE